MKERVAGEAAVSGRNAAGSVARGAAVIAVGALVSKIVGAIYRIPLTNLIGAEGIGLYQMVFPVYCALLTFSSTGLPAALSKLTADGKNARGIITRAFFLFGGIGLLGSAIMFVSGDFFASLQGNEEAADCFRALSPSVFAVSLISCARGYFQGRNDMRPTAVSQVTEQVVKMLFGLSVCAIFRGNAATAAAMAALAVTVSEVAALAYLLIRMKVARFSREASAKERGTYRKMLALTVPAALTGVALPLGHLADSFNVIRVAGRYASDATALYGLYSGSVAAVTGVPVALAYGVAVACIPALSRGEPQNGIRDSLRFTWVIALPFALFLLAFGRETIGLVYGGMGEYERLTAGRILSVDAISVLLLALLQTTNAVLLAIGKQKIPVYSLGFALVVRAALGYGLCSLPSLGVLGAAIAANVSYAAALAVNLRFCVKREIVPGVLLDVSKCLFCSITCVSGGFYAYTLWKSVPAFLVVSALTAAVYLLSAALSGLGKGLFAGGTPLRKRRAVR